MTEETLAGSCLCGSIQFTVSGDPQKFYHCHCRRCRKLSGTGHATNLLVKADAVSWNEGKSLLGYYKVPDAELFYSQFCTQCGSPLPRTVPEIGMVVIPAGSLDCSTEIQPQARIFWDSRAEWSCQAGGLPTFPEYPDA